MRRPTLGQLLRTLPFHLPHQVLKILVVMVHLANTLLPGHGVRIVCRSRVLPAPVSSDALPPQLVVKPSSGHAPVALDGVRRDLQRRGRLRTVIPQK
jgi:hypothetical protein